jgi:hypothetical protein
MAARRPFSASDVLRNVSPRKSIGGTFLTVNKFAHLRSASPSPDPGPEGRNRIGSVSQKRKNSDDGNGPTYANMVCNTGAGSGTEHVSVPAPTYSVQADEKSVMEIIKVKSITEKVDKEISEANADGTVLSILKSINDAVALLCNAVLKPGQPGAAPPQSAAQAGVTMVSLGAIPKKQRVVESGAKSGSGSGSQAIRLNGFVPQGKQKTNAATVPPVPPEEQSFRDAVKYAEKSTLVFNLNMGSVPILNTDTMSKRATLALTSMAAVAEGNSADKPSKDTIAMIDDVMSVSTGIHFYGSSTKSYKHPNDTQSGLFCTVPVRYEFNDKDTRINAEQILRTKCNAKCATPYPPILRECIRRVINDAKKDFPDNLIKVMVDPTKLALKVARRPNKDDSKKWIYALEDIPLPKEVLDVRSRRIPDGLNVGHPKFPLPVNGPTPPKSPATQSPLLPMSASESMSVESDHE